MAGEATRDVDAGLPLAALHLVVTLLGEVESATPNSSFWDRLAEATCTLGRVERAVVFLFDDALRRVRAVGSHGIDLDLFAAAQPTLEDAPLAARALELDRVVVAAGDLSGQLPGSYVELLGLRNTVCLPIGAGRKGYGVVIADMGSRSGLDESERDLLWTLGKVCALAASARAATRQQERARQLADRLNLARDLHDRVVQRLFGISLALDGEGELPAADRERCSRELHAAQEDLRAAMSRPFAPDSAPVPDRTLRMELGRLAAEARPPVLRIDWEPGAEILPAHESLAQSVLGEALRNARKHANAAVAEITVRRAGDALLLEILTDGAGGERRHGVAPGMGLRLLAFEALHHGAAVDFGPTPPDRWHVRLLLPEAQQ